MNPAVVNLTLFLVCLIELRQAKPDWKEWHRFLTAFLLTVIVVRFL